MKKPVGKRPANSDDSDELVITVDGSRNRRGRPRKEIYGSGGLGAGDQQNAHKLRGNKKQKLDVSQSPGRHGSMSRTSQAPVQAQSSRMPPATSPSKANRAPTRSKRSSPTPSAPPTQSKPLASAQTTPGMENSILGRFKRRPRQPSILQLVDQDHSSDLDGGDSYADFLPADESTPLKPNVSRGTVHEHAPSTSLPDSQKRKMTPLHGRPSGTPATSPLATSPSPPKQAHNKIDDSEAELPDLPTSSRGAATKTNATEPDLLSETMAPPHSSSSPLQSPKHVDSRQPLSRQKTDNPGQAPLPKSNPHVQGKKVSQHKPPGPPQLSTDQLRQSLLPRRRHHVQRPHYGVANDFDIPEDSENEDSSRGGHQQLASDEDELSFQPTNKGAKKRAQSAKPKASAKGKVKAGQGDDRRANKKHNAKKKGDKPALQKISTTTTTPLKRNRGGSTAKSSQKPEKGGATYSSHRHAIDIDKENLPSDTFNESLSPVTSIEKVPDLVEASNELKQVAKKFAEIDDWDMEFEEVTIDGLGSSSPSRR